MCLKDSWCVLEMGDGWIWIVFIGVQVHTEIKGLGLNRVALDSFFQQLVLELILTDPGVEGERVLGGNWVELVPAFAQGSSSGGDQIFLEGVRTVPLGLGKAGRE